MNTGIIAQILNLKDEFLTNRGFRKYFRSRIRQNLSEPESKLELPSISSIAHGPAIDENTITKLNLILNSEEKKNFLTNILNFKNLDFNVYFLILNSSEEVREYIIEVLTHSVLGMSTLNLHFYDIANIYLYILANSENYTCKDVLEHLKKGMLMYDSKVLDAAYDLKHYQEELFKQNDPIQKNVIEVNPFKNSDSDKILNSLKLRTEEQLEQNKNEFYQQVEEQEQEKKTLNQKKILKILGISLLCQMVLVAWGLPPFTRIVNKTIKSIFDIDN